MPDDELGLEPQEPAAEPAPAEPTPATPAESALTQDQLQTALASGNQPVLEALQNLATTLAAQAEPGTPPVEPSELAERLLTDPDSVLNEKMNEWGKQNLAQPMSRSFEVDRDERIEARVSEIDTTYGDGFFDANIRPRLTGPEGNLNAWTINQQADPRIIDAAINAIIGNDMRDSDKMETMQKALSATAKAKQERDVANVPHMMGPGRSQGVRPDKLTPDMQTALAGFQEAGVKITEADLKASMARENTLEAYRAQGAK